MATRNKYEVIKSEKGYDWSCRECDTKSWISADKRGTALADAREHVQERHSAVPTEETVIVSYSELDTYRQCPLKHFLAYAQRYTKPPKPDSALAKGSLYHAVMEMHYKAIMKAQHKYPAGRIPVDKESRLLDKITQKVDEYLRDEQTGEFYSDQHALISWMYEGYVEQYGIDRQWKIMAVEHQIVTPLRDEQGNRSRYHLKAKIDLLVMERATGKLWVIDHKSGANLPSQMDLEIDDQFGLYCWAMNQMGRPVAGAIHSANRTTRNQADYPDYTGKSRPQTLEQRMKRTYLARSDKELKNIAFDAYEAAKAAHPPKGQQRARYSSPDPRQCGWKCDFKEAHILMRKGVKAHQAMSDYGFRIDRTRH